MRYAKMENQTINNPIYKLWVLLAQTRRALLKLRQRELGLYGISSKHSALMFTVEAIADKATIAEISRWLFLEPHGVSELVTRMERKGLVKRAKDLGNKKLVRVILTKKGCEICNKTRKLEYLTRIMSCLSEEERQQLASYLYRLRDRALDELVTKYELPYPISE
jgi:DNA-binding MarR family transcriptional regulator